MLALSSNYMDVEKYYLHTNIKLKETGDILYYVSFVNSKYITLSYKTSTNETQCSLIDIEGKGYLLDYTIPRKMVYQDGEYAIMLSRIPAKQWKKGASTSNTKFHLLLSKGWTNYEFSYDTLKKYPSVPRYSTQEDINEGKCISYALSNRFSLTNEGKLFLDSTYIGQYNIRTFTLLTHPLLFEPLKKLLLVRKTEDFYAII